MLFRFLLNVKVTEFNKSCPNISSEFFSNNKVISSETHTFSRVTIRLLNSRTVNVKFLTFFWSVPMVTYSFSCLYTKSSYKNVNKKSLC
jgi:hypothetical protein